jgi:hypothetical protein
MLSVKMFAAYNKTKIIISAVSMDFNCIYHDLLNAFSSLPLLPYP